MKGVKFGLERFKMGLRDGLKLDRSLTLVWGQVFPSPHLLNELIDRDRELRTLVLKSTYVDE
jgi:hypothetical protein